MITHLRIPKRTLLFAIAFLMVVMVMVPVGVAGSAHATVSYSPTAVHRINGNVYEYDYIVPTGSDVHHRVGLHRLVQVVHGQPIVAPDGVFLVHGDIWDFTAAFRAGSTPSQAIAVYLAKRGLDVWGIDLGWTLVPPGTTNFTFMRGWGLQRDITDVEHALTFAREVRAQTGSPSNKLALLGWSRGGWIGYGLLNEESQEPVADRQVRAFIPVDTFFKVNNPTIRARMCSFEQSLNTDIENGIYAFSEQYLSQLGRLAERNPGGTSPVLGSPYTNRQASLLIGAAIYQFGPSFAPYYHFVGGVFPGGNVHAIPTRLAYTDFSRWNDFLIGASPFESTTLIRDTYAVTCDRSPSRFDDHLKDITVPVLYVGAGGGFGAEGLYSLSLLGSTDVTTHIVSFFPPDEAALDFGHVDLFHARNAQHLVWTSVYNWLNEHTPGSAT